MTLCQILNLSGLEVPHLKNGADSSHEVEGPCLPCPAIVTHVGTMFSSLLSACEGELLTNRWKTGQGDVKALVLDDRPT